MTKKETDKETLILEEVYNLILNSDTWDSERKPLITLKNNVEKGRYFDRELWDLSYALRTQAIKKLTNKENLSKEVGKFYLNISTAGLWNQNLSRGLIMYSSSFNSK